LIACLPILSIEDLEAALEAHMPGRHKRLLPKNYEALRKGAECAKKQTSLQ